MNLTLLFSRQLRWLNLPGALLLALLQRSPAVQVAATAAEFVAASPVGNVLRAVALAATSLGALHSMAGATVLTASSPTPLSATVGVAIPQIAMTVTGAQTVPGSFNVTGPIPPGLTISGLTGAGGAVNTATLQMTGTPTTAGSYRLVIRAWADPNLKGDSSSNFSYTINVAAGAAVAPVFTAQPASQTVSAGSTVTFSTTASGSPAPAFQWRKGSTAITGATSATLTLPNVQTTDAASYTVTASNSAGTATSNAAILTVNPVTSAPLFTTQPTSQTVNAGATATFTSAASGSPTPTFQWSFNGTPISGATNAALTLTNVQSSAAGSYTVVATNSAGAVTSSVATLALATGVGLPTFTTQPTAQTTMAIGSTVVFAVAASNATSFQWKFNGATIAGATNAMFVVPNLAATQAGAYTCVATNAGGSVTSNAAALTVGNFSSAETGHLINVSILTIAGAGSKTLTVGAVIGPLGSSTALPLVIRAVGPTLGTLFGINGALADPVMTVNASGNPVAIATNDNWGGGASMTNAFAAVGAFALPAASLDSAFVAVNSGGLLPGGYTVQVTGKGDATGTVIAEIYDAGDATRTATTPRLINLSTLTSIDAGASLAAGFVLRGSTSRTLLVRGIGPSLAALGVGGTMADPKLEFFNNDTGVKIAENDNWGGDAQLTTAMASVGAFALSGAATKDAVLLITLPPGAYSARVSDTAGGAGTAIVEIYEVP